MIITQDHADMQDHQHSLGNKLHVKQINKLMMFKQHDSIDPS